MNIHEKLAVVQQELTAPKNQYNKFGNYYYRSCEDILEGLKPLLQKVKAAVKITDDVVHIGDRYYIKASAIFCDCESDAIIGNTAFAREEDTVKGMSASQITGSASSYARKYALNGLFCIDDVKDADSRDNSQNGTSDQQKGKAKQSDSEQKKIEDEQKKIENMKISEIKVKSLAARLENEGMSAEKITRLYKVNGLADLTEKQFRNINDHWEDIKKVE